MRHTTHRPTLNPVTLVLALAFVLAAAVLPASAAEEGFPALAGHYEAIRQSLLHDSMDGVAQHGSQLAAGARSLDRDFTPAKAGVPAAKAGEAKELLGRVAASADGLGRAKDLESARDAFTTLSERMITLAGLAGADLSVGYCPMAKASWLQPDGKVGNPYMGQKMATCGTLEKVSEETAEAGGRK